MLMVQRSPFGPTLPEKVVTASSDTRSHYETPNPSKWSDDHALDGPTVTQKAVRYLQRLYLVGEAINKPPTSQERCGGARNFVRGVATPF